MLTFWNGQLINQLLVNQYFLFSSFSFPPWRKLSRLCGSTQDQVWAPPFPPPLHAHNRAISVNRVPSVSTRPRQRISAHSRSIDTGSDPPDEDHFKDGRRKFHPIGEIHSFYKSSDRMTTFAQPVGRLFDQMSLRLDRRVNHVRAFSQEGILGTCGNDARTVC